MELDATQIGTKIKQYFVHRGYKEELVHVIHLVIHSQSEWHARVMCYNNSTHKDGNPIFFEVSYFGKHVYVTAEPALNNSHFLGAEIAPEKRNTMETQKYMRRPFAVEAVQVSPSNCDEIAKWCGGKIEQRPYKMLGFDGVMLPAIMVTESDGKVVQARIGSFVVGMNGKFRVMRKKQFHDMFEKVPFQTGDRRMFEDGDLVQDRDEHAGIWQGMVVYVDQILVRYPFRGNILHDPTELKKIDQFSEETQDKFRLEEASNNGIPYNEAMEKINALRHAAEAALQDGNVEPPSLGPSGVGCFSPSSGDLEDRSDLNIEGHPIVLGHANIDGVHHIDAVTEINYMKVGSVVRVVLNVNYYFGEIGVVTSIDPDGKRMFVKLNEDVESEGDRTTPVAFQPDELALNDNGWGLLKVGDFVETLIPMPCDAGYMVPIGTMGKVVELTSSDLGGGVRVFFINGAEGHYFADKLLKIDAIFKQDDMVETKRVLTNTAGTQMPVGTTGRVTVVDIDGEGSGESVEVLFSDGGYAHFRPSELKKL